MDPAERETVDPPIEQQTRLARRLMPALYARHDMEPDESLLRELAEARKVLRELRLRRDANWAVTEKGQIGPKKTMGVPLGPVTTGLRVVTTVRLQQIPAGVSNLFDPETDPLLTVTVKNEPHEPRRICVTAFIEGLSARRRRDKK